MPQFKALSNITHGEEQEDGTVVETHFPYGAIVEGISKEAMKNLWNAGVLEQVDETPVPVATSTVKAPAAPAGDGGSETTDPASGSAE
jgi:hypothetical protein